MIGDSTHSFEKEDASNMGEKEWINWNTWTGDIDMIVW